MTTTYHVAWVDFDTNAGSKDFNTHELGKAIEFFANVTRHADTHFARLAECAPFQADIATFTRSF